MSAQARKVVHSDIKPENPPERASHYLDVPNMPWEATKFPGIQIKVLYSDDSGITTALFKLAPGAVVPLHEHTALEQTYVIEGTLEDHEGVCGPGQFCWRPAGNQHEAVAPNGAVILGFFLKPMSTEFGWGRDVLSLALAIQMLLWGAAQPVAGALADRYGPVPVISLGAILYGLGLIGMSFSSTPESQRCIGSFAETRSSSTVGEELASSLSWQAGDQVPMGTGSNEKSRCSSDNCTLCS